jgi:hypothetical protein
MTMRRSERISESRLGPLTLIELCSAIATLAVIAATVLIVYLH